MTNVPRGGDLDWSSRPGRFADSDASVRLVFETATPLTPKRGASRSRPYVRAVFTVAYDNARLFRELLGIVRAQNAEALDIRGTPKHVLFALSTMKLTPAQVVDPGVRVMTGYHVIDGIRRQLLIEGSVDVMRPVFDVARREKARGGRSVILCNPARSTHWFPYDRVRVVNADPEGLLPAHLSAHPLGFNTRPRRLSTPPDAYELHPDVRSYGTTRRR